MTQISAEVRIPFMSEDWQTVTGYLQREATMQIPLTNSEIAGGLAVTYPIAYQLLFATVIQSQGVFLIIPVNEIALKNILDESMSSLANKYSVQVYNGGRRFISAET